MKSLRLQPLNTAVEVATGARLLDGLLAKALRIEMACHGKGLCATCHVHVRHGQDLLTPKTAREGRTLSLIEGADDGSRLACQARVLGEGIIVEVPEGTYVQSSDDLADLIGETAAHNYLHPLTGALLIPRGKIITRTMLKLFTTVSAELKKVRQEG
jgi:ferredoxin